MYRDTGQSTASGQC